MIVNVASGKRKDDDVMHRLRAALDRHPGRFALRTVEAGRAITDEADAAIEAGFPVVVAAGGDGTIRAVASRLVGRDVTMGVLPMGTFNFFARGLNVPEDLDGAVDAVAEGKAVDISVGDINGRMFLNNASIGIYPAILQQREGLYDRWGRSRLAAYWSVASTFLDFKGPMSLRVTIDGVTRDRRSPLAFAARSAYQMEFYGLEGATEIRRDRIALLLAPDGDRERLLHSALRLARGQMEVGRDYEVLSGEDILIETRASRRLVALDGEREAMSAPFHFTLRKRALRVIAPDPTADNLPPEARRPEE